MAEFWDLLFGDGPEREVREEEERTLGAIRERRRAAREALADRKERDAEAKRQQALLVRRAEPQVGKELLREAKDKERAARALREGEIGLLSAMGLAAGPTLERQRRDEGGNGEGR